mmetsp:Transcript_4076/g.7144  ORF Transcript_4076/g.7144 Transcript_4076/m.7144 type:complete len:91 (+) Transcript_4076:206-478(+)
MQHFREPTTPLRDLRIFKKTTTPLRFSMEILFQPGPSNTSRFSVDVSSTVVSTLRYIAGRKPLKTFPTQMQGILIVQKQRPDFAFFSMTK